MTTLHTTPPAPQVSSDILADPRWAGVLEAPSETANRFIGPDGEALPTDAKLRDILDVIDYCEAHALPGRVVYRWVWCEFPAKPDDQTRSLLKAAGFRWNKQRSLDGDCSIWQHNCGLRTAPARGYDPRDKYGELDLAEARRAFQTSATA